MEKEDSQYCVYLYQFEIDIVRKALNIALMSDLLTDVEKEDLERTLECNFY